MKMTLVRSSYWHPHLVLIHLLDNSFLDYLFTNVPLPTLSQSAIDYDSPLRKYQISLKQQLLGRTTTVDNVLGSLEQCARHVHEDISLIRAGSRNEAKYELLLSVTSFNYIHRCMVDSLTGQHESAAEELTGSILLTLKKFVNRIEGDHGEVS